MVGSVLLGHQEEVEAEEQVPAVEAVLANCHDHVLSCASWISAWDCWQVAALGSLSSVLPMEVLDLEVLQHRCVSSRAGVGCFDPLPEDR